MRFRALRFHSLILLAPLLACVACNDDPPIYPPIVIIGGGALPSGATGAGNDTSTGADTSQSGGSGTTGGSSTGGSGTTGGSSTTPDGAFAHCAQFWGGDDPPVKTKCDLDNLVDGGELSGDITADRTLKGGQSYTMKGIVRVMPGKTLTIDPCTKIYGQDSSAVLIVMSSALGDPNIGCTYQSGSITPAGKLMAVGEPMAPIIFTSSKPVGQRAESDWGGVLLLGNARVDTAQPNARVPAEGLVRTECYGYHTDEFNTESSGDLEYVRIEFASQRVSADSETNGLTLAGLGSGTVLSHIDVTNSGDDCYEWFGGVADADHLVAYNCDDDMFDIDVGYSGHLQFLFGREHLQSTEVNSFAYEVTQGPGVAQKLTAAQISNATQCGSGPKVVANNERGGGYFIQTPNVLLMNDFITGFTSNTGVHYGLNISDPMKVNSTHIFNQDPIFFSNNPNSKADFDAGMSNSLQNPDRFCDCWANPPVPVTATTTAGLNPPDGFQDTKANYVGAFPDASPTTNWMKGLWVDWSNN